MASIAEFLNNPEISDILLPAIPEVLRNNMKLEWEFTINATDKTIDGLELWKNHFRFKKDKVVIDLTKIFTEFQMKQLYISLVSKFGDHIIQAAF